jgi:pyrroloquinoline quinone biosynthesis protein D
MLAEAIPPAARPRLSARARVQIDKVTGKPVLLYPEGALLLNPTAHAIVTLCTGDEAFDAIVSALAGRFQAPAQEISRQAETFLNRLRAKNLLDLI